MKSHYRPEVALAVASASLLFAGGCSRQVAPAPVSHPIYRTTSDQDSESVDHAHMSKAQIPTDEDFRELEMENDTASVMAAIILFRHKHGRAPTDFGQIRALTEAVTSKPDKLDPLLKFTWKVSKPFVDKDLPEVKEINIEVTVMSPDHPTVVEDFNYNLADLLPEPEHVKY
jgi:hypothetical protein